MLQVLIAVSVTLLVNWAHFMDWALANGHEMAWAAEGIAGRGHRCGSAPLLQETFITEPDRCATQSHTMPTCCV